MRSGLKLSVGLKYDYGLGCESLLKAHRSLEAVSGCDGEDHLYINASITGVVCR